MRTVVCVVVVIVGTVVSAGAMMTDALLRCAAPEVMAEVAAFPMPRIEQGQVIDDLLELGDGGEANLSEGAEIGQSGQVHYSVSETMTAALSYAHTFLFERASNDELRLHRFGAFSTARERDVVALGMKWDWGNSTVGFGYQLESTRPDPNESPAIGGFIPRSEKVEHAFTLGLSRSWGGE